MDLKMALNICDTCLSSDRQLYPLSKFPSLIQLNFLLTTAKVCWECSNEILRFCKFITKAITAQNILTDVQDNDDLLCLSTLEISKQQPVFEFKHIEDPLKLEFEDATNIEEEVCNSDTEIHTYHEDFEQLDNTEEDIKDNLEENLINEQLDNTEEDIKDNLEENLMNEQLDNTEEDIKDNLEENLINDENVDKKMFESQTNTNVHIKTEIDKDKQEITSNEKRKAPFDIDHKLSEVSEEVMKKILMTELTHEEVLKRRDQKRSRRKYQNYLYKCDFCIIGFINEEKLNEHIKMKHSHIDFNNVNKPGELTDCDVCKMRFKSPLVAQGHCERHYMLYKCRLCEYKAYALHFIVAHCKNKHDNETVGQTRCNRCSKILSTPEEYLEHLKREHRTCELCGYKVKRKGSIKYHMRQMHSQKGNLICDHCPKTFKSRYTFEMHMSTHGETIAKKMSHCNICNEQFKNIRDYRAHLRTSVNHVKGYRCLECNKHFASEFYGRRHYKFYHLKESGYKCEECNKMYMTVSKLKAHQRVNHGLYRPRNHECDACGRKFYCSTTLKKHKLLHSEQRQYMCSECGDTFKQSAALFLHTRKVHRLGKKASSKK